MTEELLILAGIIAGAALFIALGAWLLPKLAREEQGYPMEAKIEAVLIPIIFYGICAAYRLSEKAMDEFGQRMDGLDKKAIADALYAMLPSKVAGFDLSVIKRLVPPARFEQLVQDVFDRFDQHWVQFEGHYARLFNDWAEEFNELGKGAG